MSISEELSHILIIDDDRDMLDMLQTTLSLDGFRVTVCDDGDEGIKKAEEHRPDLIVLDVMMPGKGGLEVMKEVRTKPATKEIPIMFLSAIGDEAIVVQGLKGADDYVVKPFKALELETRIRKILGRALDGPRSINRYDNRVLERLSVQVGKETYLVPLDHIYYFEASGKYAYAHTQNKKFLTGLSIGELEKKLSPTGKFLRIHRSYIVNVDCVFKITRDSNKNMVVVVSDGQGSELRVSESYVQDLKERLSI